MSLFSGLFRIIVGAAEIAGGAIITVASGGTLTPMAGMLIASGAGSVLSGVGALSTPANPIRGFATTQRNPVAPWHVCYGLCRTGGTVVYMNEWGGSNKILTWLSF